MCYLFLQNNSGNFLILFKILKGCTGEEIIPDVNNSQNKPMRSSPSLSPRDLETFLESPLPHSSSAPLQVAPPSAIRKEAKPSKLPIPCRRRGVSPCRSLVPGTIVSQTTTKSSSSAGTRRTSDNPIGSHTIAIKRGPRGYGFTLRAKDVFYGSSDIYTLHHIVVGVDRKGPAFAAGLRENDVILRVNGREAVGRLHTDIVQMICSSTAPLRLLVTTFAQSNIRSDGRWRARGRLVSRPSRRFKTSALMKPSKLPVSSGEESGLESGGGFSGGCGRRSLKPYTGPTSPNSEQLCNPTATNALNPGAQVPPIVIERRQRHRQNIPVAIIPSPKSFGITDESSRHHSHSFSVSSRRVDSTALSCKLHLQPRRYFFVFSVGVY